MTTTVTTNKPFHIDKKRVYEAYKAVRSNRGAAGVDGQTLEQFDEDLGGNLYKIWNRMSSGSYFPPPVRAVSIPKRMGVAKGSWVCPLSAIESRRWLSNN
jgi:RNA-directed DNA polymerase